jgi:hypothetical protein
MLDNTTSLKTSFEVSAGSTRSEEVRTPRDIPKPWGAGPLVAAGLAIVLLSGCASAPERDLSTERPLHATLVDGRDPLDPERFVPRREAVYASDENLFRYYESVRGHALNILQLSGGGQNGAFGAGVLKGWRESGNRPEFDIVTGVSTGALLATHAFLGTPADDAVLEELFTGITADDIFLKEGVLGVLSGSPSLLSTGPLAALLEKHITEEVLARVAAEHDKGRRLLVGTTNLDYQRTWAWNMGAIAQQGGAEALERYRKVLLASASFPIMFPPVTIDGHLFADGAVRANILVLGLSGRDEPGPPLHGPGNVYTIQNGRLDTPPTPVRESVAALAGTSIGQMMASSTEGLLMRSYVATQVHGYEFHTIEVPGGVDIGSNPLAFDPQQMRAGFDAGYRLGKDPGAWSDVPPLLGDMPEWMIDVVRERL